MSEDGRPPEPEPAPPPEPSAEAAPPPEPSAEAAPSPEPSAEAAPAPSPEPSAEAAPPEPSAQATPAPSPPAPDVVVRARGVVAGPHLRGVDLDVPAGQITALLGPDGAGKTTLLRVLLGLDVRDRGELTVLGLDPARDPVAVRRVAGYVPQQPALYPTMTALALGRFVADLYPTWQVKRFLEHLARLGVPPRTRAADLPRAQAARLALALALGHGPRLLVVDVPHDLDALGRNQLLVGLEEEAACPVLVATSHVHEVERLARHVVVLAHGQVRFAGTPEGLAARCRHLEVPGMAEPPPLPAGVRALRWRASTPRRPGELVVELSAGAPPEVEAALAAVPGVTAARASTFEEAYLALVSGAP